MTDRHTDREWFKKNPSRNCRTRRPAEGEVAEIVRRSVPNGAADLARNGGVFHPPSEDVHWSILVVKPASDTILRMLTLSDTPDPAEIAVEGFSLYAIVMHQRIVIDRIGV